jgi:hypothetical protein
MALTVPTVAKTTANTGAPRPTNAIPVTPYVRKNYAGWDATKVNDRLSQIALEMKRPGSNVKNLSIEQDDLNRYRKNNLSTPGSGSSMIDNLIQTTKADPSKLDGFGGGDLTSDYKTNPSSPIPGGMDPAATPAPQPASTPTPEATTTTADTTPTAAPADLTNYKSPMTQALLDALGQGINSMRAYEPKFFEGSPLYQFQKEQGQKDLSKLMAARGLTGSGAEVQGYSDFLSKIGADESEKQRQYAEAQMGRNQDALRFIANYDQTERNNLRDQGNLNADRLQRYQLDQQNAAAGMRGDMLGLLQSILGLQAQTSPMTDIYKAIGGQNDVTSTLGKIISEYQANNYKKAIPTGGSSGGSSGGGSTGTGLPTTLPPPDTSSIDIAKLMGQYGNGAGNTGVLSTLLGSIF